LSSSLASTFFSSRNPSQVSTGHSSSTLSCHAHFSQSLWTMSSQRGPSRCERDSARFWRHLIRSTGKGKGSRGETRWRGWIESERERRKDDNEDASVLLEIGIENCNSGLKLSSFSLSAVSSIGQVQVSIFCWNRSLEFHVKNGSPKEQRKQLGDERVTEGATTVDCQVRGEKGRSEEEHRGRRVISR
jgi:hypothetical protein